MGQGAGVRVGIAEVEGHWVGKGDSVPLEEVLGQLEGRALLQ